MPAYSVDSLRKRNKLRFLTDIVFLSIVHANRSSLEKRIIVQFAINKRMNSLRFATNFPGKNLNSCVLWLYIKSNETLFKLAQNLHYPLLRRSHFPVTARISPRGWLRCGAGRCECRKHKLRRLFRYSEDLFQQGSEEALPRANLESGRKLLPDSIKRRDGAE